MHSAGLELTYTRLEDNQNTPPGRPDFIPLSATLWNILILHWSSRSTAQLLASVIGGIICGSRIWYNPGCMSAPYPIINKFFDWRIQSKESSFSTGSDSQSDFSVEKSRVEKGRFRLRNKARLGFQSKKAVFDRHI